MDNPNQSHPRSGKNSQHKAAAKKKKVYKAGKNLSAQEFERRMKQHEAAVAKKYAVVSSPQLRPILQAENSRLRGTQALLQALIDPDNAPPHRLPGGGKPTFVVKLRQVLSAAIVPSGAASQLTPNSGFAVRRRDPRCSLIVYQYNTSDSNYVLINPDGGNPLDLDADGYFVVGVGSFIGGFQRHGSYVLPWVFADQATRMWLQNETTSPTTVVVVGLTPATSYNMSVNFLLGGQTVEFVITAVSDGAGSAIFTLGAVTNYGGFAKFKLATTAAPAVWLKPPQVNLLDRSNGQVRFLAAPGFWDELKTIDAIRTNAASLMYSDRTAAQFSQGDICSYQASGGDSFEKMLGSPGPTSFLNCDPYGFVPTFQDGFKGPYKKGKYIPLKFLDDPREQQMRNIADSSEAWEVAPIIMNEQTDWLFIGFNFGTSQAGAPAPMGEWTSVEGNEGETESQWRLTQVPSVHPDVLKEAKWCFSQVKADFENISHLVKIWQWVKKNAPHILEVGSRAVGNAGPYGAAAAAGMGGVAEVLRLLP